ncbi:MAG TPA: hypothetical protein VK147_01845 [Candidatus Didemnitutus sp.]|nr:hypothetical protein [Candidatus Didemnitutus sp.]
MMNRILLATFTIIVNDILIRNFAGGTYDIEGAGWIMAMLLIGLIPSTLIVAFFTSRVKGANKMTMIAMYMAMPTIVFLYLSLFGKYGLSYIKLASTSKLKAVEDGVYISDVTFSTREIVALGDTIRFVSGWIEKEVVLKHGPLLQVREETGRRVVCAMIKRSYNQGDRTVYYSETRDSHMWEPIDSIVQVTTSNSKNIEVSFLKLRRAHGSNDTIIGTVAIKSI